MHTPTIARELGREFQRICLKLIPTTIREEIRGNPMRKLCLRVGIFVDNQRVPAWSLVRLWAGEL